MKSITRVEAKDAIAQRRYVMWQHPWFNTIEFVLTLDALDKKPITETDDEGFRLLDEHDLFNMLLDACVDMSEG